MFIIGYLKVKCRDKLRIPHHCTITIYLLVFLQLFLLTMYYLQRCSHHFYIILRMILYSAVVCLLNVINYHFMKWFCCITERNQKEHLPRNKISKVTLQKMPILTLANVNYIIMQINNYVSYVFPLFLSCCLCSKCSLSGVKINISTIEYYLFTFAYTFKTPAHCANFQYLTIKFFMGPPKVLQTST